MKSTRFISNLLLLAILTISLCSCQKDQDFADLTAKVEGNYSGIVSSGKTGNFWIKYLDSKCDIEKKSDTEIEVNITLFSGTELKFDAEMVDETNFTVPPFNFKNETYQGIGSLSKREVLIDLSVGQEDEETYQLLFLGSK